MASGELTVRRRAWWKWAYMLGGTATSVAVMTYYPVRFWIDSGPVLAVPCAALFSATGLWLTVLVGPVVLDAWRRGA